MNSFFPVRQIFFVKGARSIADVPKDNHPHIIFLGRSNAGKSSLINHLTGQKALARVSKQPGKTRELNFYLVNGAFYLVDAPGYGYAKAGKQLKAIFEDMLVWYLEEHRLPLHYAILICDAEVGPSPLDREMFAILLERLNVAGIVIIANKVDKISANQKSDMLSKFQHIFPHTHIVPYSSKTNVGRKELGEILST